MPLTVDWHDPEHTIILLTIEYDWRWTDFHQVIDDALTLAHTAGGHVDYIVNLLSSGPLPSGAIEQVRLVMSKITHNWGTVVVVQQNPFITAMTQAFLRLYPAFQHKVVTAGSLNEAETLILKHRNKNAVE